MKKILFSLACTLSFVLTFTSCSNDKIIIYYSNLTGIYTSESASDTSTVILAPQGKRDMIMIQANNDGEKDSIYLTPVVVLDNENNVGNFSDTSTGWQGNFTFSDYGQEATLTMTNQKTGKTLPVISLTKSQFGSTLAGNWANESSPGKNKMSIVLCRPGCPDYGTLTIGGTDHIVYVYGPSSKYGNGTMYISSDEGWFWAKYQLSGLDEDYNQSILIYLSDTETMEMKRLFEE